MKEKEAYPTMKKELAYIRAILLAKEQHGHVPSYEKLGVEFVHTVCGPGRLHGIDSSTSHHGETDTMSSKLHMHDLICDKANEGCTHLL